MQNWPATRYHIMWFTLWPYCELMLATMNAAPFETEAPRRLAPKILRRIWLNVMPARGR